MSLSAMKQRKLAAAGVGSRIELTLPGGRILTGEIGDNDGVSLEILGDGFDTVVDYEELEGFLLLEAERAPRCDAAPGAAAAPSPAPVPKPEPAPVIEEPVPTLSEAERLRSCIRSAISRSTPYYWSPPELPMATDGRLRELFRALDRAGQRRLSSVFDSLMNAFRVTDADKMNSNSAKLRSILQSDPAFAAQDGVALLAGCLLRRARAEAGEVFAQGGLYFEAACCEYLSSADKRWDRIAEYACMALAGDSEQRDALCTLFTMACLRTGDASLLPRLASEAGDFCRAQLLAMTAYLAQAGELPLDCSADLVQQALQVARAYPAGYQPAPARELDGLLTAYDARAGAGTVFVDDAPCSVDRELVRDEALSAYLDSLHLRDLESEPLPVLVRVQEGKVLELLPRSDTDDLTPEEWEGNIFRLNWGNSTGLITASAGNEARQFTFRYSDIASFALHNRVQELMKTDLSRSPIPVRFIAQREQAVQIANGRKSPAELLTAARRIIADAGNENRYRDVTQILIPLLDTEVAPAALCTYLDVVIAQFKKDHDREALLQASLQFDEHSRHYPKSVPAARTHLTFCRCLGDPEKIREGMDRLLSLGEDQVDPRNLAVNLAMCLAVCLEEYRLTHETEYLDRDRILTKKLEDLIAQHPYECGSQRFVALTHRIFLACVNGDLDTAETIFSENEGTGFKLDASTPVGQMLEELREQRRQDVPAPDSKFAPVQEPAARTAPAAQTAPVAAVQEETPRVSAAKAEEAPPLYRDSEGWEALAMNKADAADYVMRLSGPSRLPVLLAYLRAASGLQSALTPLYQAVSIAVDNPLEIQDYSAGTLLRFLNEGDPDYAVLNDWAMGAAVLRSLFRAVNGQENYLYLSLHASIHCFTELPELENVYALMQTFLTKHHSSLDICSDYLRPDDDAAVTPEQLSSAAAAYYQQFIATPPSADPSFRLTPIIKGLIYSRDSLHARLLLAVAEQEPTRLSQAQALLRSCREEFEAAYLDSDTVSDGKLSRLIDETATQAGRTIGWASTEFMGSRRENIRRGLTRILDCIRQWYDMDQRGLTPNPHLSGDKADFAAVRDRLTDALEALYGRCQALSEQAEEPERRTGAFLMRYAARDLIRKLQGLWEPRADRLFLFADFLRSDWIQLDSRFRPELASTLCALPDFNVLARLRHHAEEPRSDVLTHMNAIFARGSANPNYGTAELILEYLDATGRSAELGESEDAPWNDPESYIEQSERQAQKALEDFQGFYALARSGGQLTITMPILMEMEDIIRYWHAFCYRTKNFGFLFRLIRACKEHVRSCATQYEAELDSRLDLLMARYPQVFDTRQDIGDRIRELIRDQRFTAAEQLMNSISQPGPNPFIQESLTMPEALIHLRQFWMEYSDNYLSVCRADTSLKNCIRTSRRAFPTGGQLIDGWVTDSLPDAAQVENLLTQLGWKDLAVTELPSLSSEQGLVYHATLPAPMPGPWSTPHPIAAFGSVIRSRGFFVVCIRGTHTCDSLLARFHTLERLQGAKLVLLDYALTTGERRALAERIKKRDEGFSGSNPYLVLDRVLLCYLADHYSGESVNRILMATGMPFSYYQPYVPNSVDPLPTELFIGRRDELNRIKESDGVNLVYGGRQLGKSALLRKARSDIDGVNGCRAFLVDLHLNNCADSARAVSSWLANERDGILSPESVTDDWTTLTRAISDRLLSTTEPEITYLLLLLDESDSFLADCARQEYRPISVLKKLQETLPGRFKCVLAGLHNVVRFHRDVALGNNSPVPHLPSLNVKPFSPVDGIRLVTEPLSYLGFYLSESSIAAEILAPTSYFPGLIQLFCKHLLETVRASDYGGYHNAKVPAYLVTEEHIHRVMMDADFCHQVQDKQLMTLQIDQKEADGGYYYPLALLLSVLDKEQMSHTGYTAAQLREEAVDIGVQRISKLTEEQVATLLQELTDLNVLRPGTEPGAYLFASKTFRDLLGTEQQVLEKLVAINAGS